MLICEENFNHVEPSWVARELSSLPSTVLSQADREASILLVKLHSICTKQELVRLPSIQSQHKWLQPFVNHPTLNHDSLKTALLELVVDGLNVSILFGEEQAHFEDVLAEARKVKPNRKMRVSFEELVKTLLEVPINHLCEAILKATLNLL